MADNEPIDPIAAEILGMESESDTEVNGYKEPKVPDHVQKKFKKQMETEYGDKAITQLEQDHLFISTKNIDGVTRSYYGYFIQKQSDEDETVSFLKRVECKFIATNGQYKPTEVNWYDEQGKNVMASLTFGSDVVNGIRYTKTPHEHLMFRWNHDTGELDWHTVAHVRKDAKEAIVREGWGDVTTGVLKIVYGEDEEAKDNTFIQRHLKHGGYHYPEYRGHPEMFVKYDDKEQVVTFESSRDGEPIDTIFVRRFLHIDELLKDLFPEPLNTNPSDSPIENDDWKNNQTVEDRLGFRWIPHHPTT